MAARTPTAFSTTIPDTRPRKQILASSADDILDDQQLVLDKDEMVIGDHFVRVYHTGAGAWTAVRRYYTRAPDMCGTAATIAGQFSLLTKSLVAAVNYDVAIYHNGRAVRHSYTVAANHTTLLWRAWTAITLYGDGTENELIVQVNAPAAQAIWVAGVAIFTGT